MANQLGISSKVPTVLAYPKVYQYKDVPELKGIFVYVIEQYPLNGLTAVATRFKDDSGTPIVTWQLGDWDGRIIDMTKEHPNKNMAKEFMLSYSDKLLGVMQKIGLTQAQYYITTVNKDMVLTDVRTHANKFLGPGATDQVFNNVIRVQRQIIQPLVLDDANQDKIAKKVRPFNVPIIFKPSAFKTITRGRELQPMYGLL